jgi:hypothetical protein
MTAATAALVLPSIIVSSQAPTFVEGVKAGGDKPMTMAGLRFTEIVRRI